MKAVILVGGEGTRLRPLSCNTPKPMLSLANKPFLEYLIELLKKHSVKEIILSSYYLVDSIKAHFGEGSKFDVSISYVVEDFPLGTGGAIKNVEKFIDNTFVVFNGDVLTDLNIGDLISYHFKNKAKATIALTSVEDPTLYGLVELNPNGAIARFLEKPSWDQVTSNLINAGTYVLEPAVLDYIPTGKNYSVERGLFPTLLDDRQPLFGYVSDSYWLDIGTPAKYILAHHDILEGKIEHNFAGREIKHGIWVGEGTVISPEARISPPLVIGRKCQVLAHAKIAGLSTIGDSCVIEANAALEGCVILDNCLVGEKSVINNSILGREVKLGKRVHISDEAVIGDYCVIEDDNYLGRGIKIWPGTRIDKGKIQF